MYASLKAMDLDEKADEDEDDDSNWILGDEVNDEPTIMDDYPLALPSNLSLVVFYLQK